MSLFGLFKPGWQSEDWRKREKAVAKISDQRILAKIAKEASHGETRATAIEKLDARQHQALLLDIAKNDKNTDVLSIAVRNPEHPRWLFVDF